MRQSLRSEMETCGRTLLDGGTQTGSSSLQKKFHIDCGYFPSLKRRCLYGLPNLEASM